MLLILEDILNYKNIFTKLSKYWLINSRGELEQKYLRKREIHKNMQKIRTRKI